MKAKAFVIRRNSRLDLRPGGMIWEYPAGNPCVVRFVFFGIMLCILCNGLLLRQSCANTCQGEKTIAVSGSIPASRGNEWIHEQFKPSCLQLAVWKNDQLLLNGLAWGTEKLESHVPDTQNQLTPVFYEHKNSGAIPFSSQESDFISESKKTGKVFSVILNPDRKPFSWLENGQYRGLFKEYADELSRRTGLEFQFVPVESRKEYEAKRFSPDVDIVFDMILGLRLAEEKQMRLSQPFFAASISRLRDKHAGSAIRTVSLLKNDCPEEIFRDILPADTKVRYCDSYSDLVKDIMSSTSDAAYLFTRSAEYAVYEDMSNRLVSEYVPILETDFALGVREDLDPLLLSVLNRGVQSLDESFANEARALYAPKFKEVFSIDVFVHQYPFRAIGLAVMFFLLICALLIGMLVHYHRRRKELQRSLTKWNAAARIAKIRSFQMHVPTRRVCGDADLLGLFWRVENGVAAPVCDWVCPEDAPVVEKAHDDFANGLNDHFWVNYRVIQNGVTRYFVCYAVRDADDPDMMVGIVHDVTETKEAESQRDTVQQLWKNVIDHSPVMMFVKAEDDDFRYIQCNRDFAAFVGRSPEEVVGRTDAELFNRPQDAQEFREIDRQVMASGRPRKFQESAQDVHGQLRHIQTVKMSIKDANGQMLLIGMSMDVTELKNSRDEAQKHEEMFRLTIQSIGDGVLITDEHGSIQLLNPVAEHLIGMSSAQAKGKPHEEVFRIVNLSSDTPVVSPLVKALTSGEIAELGSDADLLSFDGNRYHIADCAGPIRNLNNEIIGAVMIFRDITGEYKYREELRDSVALWNLTADIAKLMPFRMHIPTRQVLGDVERLRQYWPIVDGKAVLPKDWICAEDCEQVDREYEKFAAGEIDRFLATYRVICDGKTRYYRRYAVRDAKDADVMVGIIQDITLDKELEYERDSSRALWEQVVEAMPILMFVKSADDDFRYVQCNDNFANYIGRPKAEIVGHTDMEFIPCQEEKEHFRLWDDKIMAEGKVQEFYEESQGAHKYYHFQTVKMPFTDARGKRLLIGLAVDISSGKKAEEERNAARTLLNNAFAAMPIILYIKAADRDFRYIQCNDNFCKLFGKTESEILGHTDEEIFCRPQEVKVFRDADITVMETGKPIDIIETLSGSDNKTYHFRAVKMSGTNFDGERILIGMSVDITELVEQREQIQASRNQLQVGCRMTRCFTFELGEDRQISTTNGLFKELIPHVDGKALSPEEWVVPEDIQITLRKLEVFYEKQIGEIAVNFRTDWFGKRRYYKCVLTRDGDHVYGVTSDVTELVEASEEVKESSLMWKRVMDELPVRFFVKDVDNDCRYIMCNKANADFFGLPEKAFVGKTTEEVCKPSHAIAKYLADEQRILQDRTVSHMRISMPDAHGIICDMEKIEMPITGPKNRSLLIGIAFDVTEREQSLRLAEICAQILARVVDEPDFSKVLDHIGEATTGILNCRRVIFAKCDDEGALRYLQDTDVDPNYHVSKQSIALHEHYWSLYVDRLRRNELVKFERMGNDVLLEPLFEHHPEYRNMALIGTPILENDQLYGVMIISFPGPHVFTEYEVRTLRAICNCILMAANRSRQTQALLQAQEEQAWQLAERTALNECLAIFMASDYMDVPFKEILDSIRSYLGASHCYVMLFDSEKKQATALAEASAAEDHPFLMGAPPLAFDQNSLWFTELKEKYVVGWPDFTADEARARLDSSWPAIEEVYQVRSLWVAALETNEKIQGALGIVYGDDSKKTFRLQDESFVRSAARVVSLIMTRVQHRNELITALETQLDTAECLRYMVGDEDVLVAIRHLLDIIRKHTGADVAFMAELNEDSDAARTWGKLTMDSNFSDSDVSEVPFGPNEEWYLLLKQDKPLHIEDTAKTAADDILGSWAFLLHGDYPMRSCYEIPIYCDGHLWGAVGIMYAKATPLSQNNADFMTNAKKFFEILLSRQESRQKLDVAAKRAQAAEQAKSFFLASMSHEIRTPLNAVIGFTEILKDSEMADETQAEYIDNIHVASNALLRLINDILDLSKLEAGQMQLIPERINFPAFCKEICRTFQYVAKQKNVQLDVMIDEDMPPLMVDQIRMRQIFFNLIGNAVKFTPEEGRVTVSVEFSRLSFSAGSLLLKFADTGIGMSEADQKKIFEPFVQLSKFRGTNASTTGTGLGLSIVRRLVDKMGGTLTVESVEDEGTTFFILLPDVEMADEGDQEFAAEALPDGSRQRARYRAPAVSSDPLRVLVVDDMPINVKVLTVLLKRFGVTCDTASSGAEALEKLKLQPFNWILTDMYMHGMSGVELAQAVRKNSDYANVRLGVVTADIDAIGDNKSFFDAFLSKPVDRQQVYQCLFGGEK